MSESQITGIIEYIIIGSVLVVFLCIMYKWYITDRKHTIDNFTPLQIPDLKNKTIVDVLQSYSKQYPDFPALMVRKDNGNWSSISYEDYYKNCRKFAKELNYWVGPGAKVAILGFNSPAWMYSHLGSLFNSGISIGIYPTSSSDLCEFILNHADVDVLVVEDDKQLEKFIDKKIPTLKLILYYSPVSNELVKRFDVPVVSFGVFMSNKSHEERKHHKTIAVPDIDSTATIIYTSGTTGTAKGAIITHKNIISAVESIINTIQNKSGLEIGAGERFVSYLPLNHIAAQMMDIYIPICTLGSVWFADKDALKSTLVNTLKDARPTIFVGVPRVWEKMVEKINEKVQSNFISRNLPMVVVRNKIVNELGLNKCKYCISSTAPISDSSREYFESLGISLYDVYGCSETTGPITLSVPNATRSESVGKPIDIVRIKIHSDGEILVKGKSIFKGYHKDPKSTKEAFIDGWFKTGDIGNIKDGFLFITGRKKEIIVTSGGENIAPVPIEQNIMKEIPGLEYAVVIGDKRKFLSVILVPKIKDNIPTYFKKIDPEISSCKDLNISKIVQAHVDDAIVRANEHAQINASKIQKWIFLENEFSVGQELTPTLKLRRYFINEKYKDKINKLYKES